jgi:hypothetical protein
MDGAIDATSALVYWWCCRCPHCILDLDAGRTASPMQPWRQPLRLLLYYNVSYMTISFPLLCLCSMWCKITIAWSLWYIAWTSELICISSGFTVMESLNYVHTYDWPGTYFWIAVGLICLLNMNWLWLFLWLWGVAWADNALIHIFTVLCYGWCLHLDDSPIQAYNFTIRYTFAKNRYLCLICCLVNDA